MGEVPTIALSVRQPWAWAIIHGGKDIENRSAAAVRHGMKPGRIAIHASKGMTRDEYEDAEAFMSRTLGIAVPPPDQLVRGAIIGAVTVTDIVSASESKWFFGPRGLVLSEAKACDPIPAKGALGYFKWTPGGEIDPAKPWMMGQSRIEPQTAPIPLFEASEPQP
jgi:hypothetical protein